MTIAMTDQTTSIGVDGAALARRLRGLKRKGRMKALLLVAPLMLFLIAIFVLPIGMLLTRSVDNSEVAETLPNTVARARRMERRKRARRGALRRLRRRSESVLERGCGRDRQASQLLRDRHALHADQDRAHHPQCRGALPRRLRRRSTSNGARRAIGGSSSRRCRRSPISICLPRSTSPATRPARSPASRRKMPFMSMC